MHLHFVRIISIVLVQLAWFSPPSAVSQEPPFLTVDSPLRLLSANDGEMALALNEELAVDTSKKTEDSITVVDLFKGQPPRVRTVYGIVSSTLIGSPHIAVSDDGKLGFVANHAWRMDDPTDETTDYSQLPKDRRNVLAVIDLDAPEPRVVQELDLPREPWMVDQHTDGRIFVACGPTFRVYERKGVMLQLVEVSRSPVTVTSFDLSPDGQNLIAVGVSNLSNDVPLEQLEVGVHLFAIRGNQVVYRHEVGVPEGIGGFHGPFSPRFSPDSTRVLVLNGFGMTNKGQLDDVLSIDMTLEKPRITEKIPQVADGLESLAFSPDGKLAVVTCLGKGPWSAPTGFGRLAAIDLTSKPARLLYQTPIEIFPEGIEFSPDGNFLFVGCTFADHIAVFKVDGFRLQRSPFILHCGHGPVSLGLSRQTR